jgi:sulfate permease, SulP family
MSDLFQIDPHASRHPHLNLPQIQGVMTYEIAGPLFFGAAQKAIASLIPHARDQRVVILDMRAVPTMDITGLVALQSALATLEQRGTYVVLAGVRAQPRQLLEKAGVVEKAGVISLCEDADEAALMARLYLGIEDVGT